MFRNIVRKALRIKGKILETDRRHGKNRGTYFSYYGGFDLGYLVGQLSILEDVMTEDEFKDFQEKEKLLILSFNNSTLRKLKREKINKILKRRYEYED